MYLDGLLLQKEPPQDTSVVWGIPNGDSVTLMIHVDGVWRPINGSGSSSSSSDSSGEDASGTNNESQNIQKNSIVDLSDKYMIDLTQTEEVTSPESAALYVTQNSEELYAGYEDFMEENNLLSANSAVLFTDSNGDEIIMVMNDGGYSYIKDGIIYYDFSAIGGNTGSCILKYRYWIMGDDPDYYVFDIVELKEIEPEDVAKICDYLYLREYTISLSGSDVATGGLVFHIADADPSAYAPFAASPKGGGNTKFETKWGDTPGVNQTIYSTWIAFYRSGNSETCLDIIFKCKTDSCTLESFYLDSNSYIDTSSTTEG